jgi:hypothetical protein
MPPAIVVRERVTSISARASVGAEDADAANDNVPTHALWRKVVAAGIGVLFAVALVLIGLVCTTHAAEFSTLSSSAQSHGD